MAKEINIITETTAEQYFVEVLTPQIDKIGQDYASIQQEVNSALERPVTLGKEAISSFIAEIKKPMEKMISSTKCELPDTESLEIRISDAVKEAAKAGIAETTLNIEVHHSVQLEEATKERMDLNERRLESISKAIDIKPLTFWERLMLKVETGVIAAVVLTAAIWIPIQLNSPEHWGMRYHKVCNDPIQNDEGLLSRRDVAFADVFNMFGKNKESKQMMKAYIRENEQRLLRLRRGDRLSQMTGDEKEK